MSSSEAPADSASRIVLRNTAFLVIAKVLATPITIMVGAITARYIGSETYSRVYLAATYVSFGALLVDFGGSGTVPAMVAKDRTRAGEFLGSTIVWRLVAAVLVYSSIGLGCHLLGYPVEFERVFALVIAAASIQAITAATLDTIRGFERTDVDAILSVGTPLLTACITIPILLAGGRLKAVLTGDLFLATAALLLVRRLSRRVPIGRVSFNKDVLKTLLTTGSPFLFFGLAMTLQPSIDAFFLAKYSPAAVVGWHGAARKLVGLLVYPASALIAALYPVLCRLSGTNPVEFARATASSLRSSLIFVVPAALGCALFPEIGVSIYGKAQFGPAQGNLRILSVFVLLVYFSMPLGSALLALGKARAWSIVQSLCVVLSLILDPLLVPWFQRTSGNGGLGICVSNVISEVFMVGLGLWLLPGHIVDRTLLRAFALAAVSGGAMALTARVLSSITFWIAAPCAVVAYVAAGFATGILNAQQLQAFRSIVTRKAR
jgi:O-antigen/teichoic acid export membrane protein